MLVDSSYKKLSFLMYPSALEALSRLRGEPQVAVMGAKSHRKPVLDDLSTGVLLLLDKFQASHGNPALNNGCTWAMWWRPWHITLHKPIAGKRNATNLDCLCSFCADIQPENQL
jgi:hypothetical protein